MELTEADYVHTPTGTRQRDLTVTQTYDAAYLRERYAAIDDRVRELADRRVRVLEAFVGPPAGGSLLDFGCGVGAVVEAARRRGWHAAGCDLIPGAGVLHPGSVPGGWDVVTFFDSLEHLPDPAGCVESLAADWVMVSVPWCHHPYDWVWFGGWKHRRPGEHLHHWSRGTLANFFGRLGYAEVVSGCVEDDFRPNPQQAEPNVLTALFRRAER